MYRVKIQLIVALLLAANSLMAQTGIITTIAGNRSPGSTVWGSQATATAVAGPREIAIDYAGNIYIVTAAPYVSKVDAAGIITRFAGMDIAGYAGDGGAATDARIGSLRDVATDGWGNVYISDYTANVVRKIDVAQTITTFAGNGASGYNGDELPAISTSISPIAGLCAGPAGSMFMVDVGNRRLRMVDASGILHTVCGTGIYGYTGDGGPATSATLFRPYGVAVSAIGEVYLSDIYMNTIRKIDITGTITTIAGDSVAGYDGDGGPATAAHLSDPIGIALDGDGNLFIADRDNLVIRKIDTDGIITTVAGTHVLGFSGDGGPATDAKISYPTDVAVDKDGNLYFTDNSNNVIRKVTGVAAAVRNPNKQSLQVFPMPCMGMLHAQLPARTDWKAELMDMTGRVVAAQSGNAQVIDWSLPCTLPNATYCLRVTTAESSFVDIIMLQR